MDKEKDVLGYMVADDQKLKLKIKKLHPDAQIPTRGSASAAGFDLYAVGDYKIMPQQSVMISTGIAMEIPEGYGGFIFARSGLATKQHLRPSNCVGVVDSDYRNEVMVSLYNDNPMIRMEKQAGGWTSIPDVAVREVKNGDRIAQIVFLPYIAPDVVEVEELSKTERDQGGFGSTGR